MGIVPPPFMPKRMYEYLFGKFESGYIPEGYKGKPIGGRCWRPEWDDEIVAYHIWLKRKNEGVIK